MDEVAALLERDISGPVWDTMPVLYWVATGPALQFIPLPEMFWELSTPEATLQRLAHALHENPVRPPGWIAPPPGMIGAAFRSEAWTVKLDAGDDPETSLGKLVDADAGELHSNPNRIEIRFAVSVTGEEGRCHWAVLERATGLFTAGTALPGGEVAVPPEIPQALAIMRTSWERRRRA